MTRFARAKGSKSCNEKTPDDGTPWEVMKEQLILAKQQTEEAGKREEAEKKRIENYENFLKEQKTQKRKATWCEFEETKKETANNQNMSSNKKKTKKHNISNSEHVITENTMTENNKKKNKKIGTVESVADQVSEEKQIEKLKNTPDAVSKNTKKRKAKTDIEPQSDNAHPSHKQNNLLNANKKIPEKKKKKFLDGKPVRRKVIDDQSFQIIINGKEVELVRYDGFPVMKKDAERLQELRVNMIKKGIPKSEVQRTMKLERRRAEKALARVKREVCYNCRKGGHNLSDCPELKSRIPGVDAGDGICFKCGSTEHKQFECKVQRDQEFRFATCFFCKEQGHIARQCPDNPKGLYPNGGCCKLCGDVTHLKKDCPTMNNTKEATSLKLQTLDGSGNIEEEIMQKQTTHAAEKLKKTKKIKF